MKLRSCQLIILIIFPVMLFASPGKSKYWIFFSDKGQGAITEKLAKPNTLLTPRSLKRRAKVYPGNMLVDVHDIPVYPEYIHQIKLLGPTPINRSKWLNAISVFATPAEIDRCANLAFVKNIQPVLTGKRSLPGPESDQLSKPGLTTLSDTAYSEYGYALNQNSQINIPPVHDKGYNGQGVLIAIMDTGFKTDHYALDPDKIIDTWDFIHNNANVDNETIDDDIYFQITHGTSVLGIIGAYAPGKLIGAAYGAEFLLAKTEDTRIENEVEEDYWIAAAEWADSLGADIISSSVGYLDWYYPEEMDGKTAPITLAADMAVEKGIVVVISAGNEGDIPWRIISAPADGFNVISVGAVNSEGEIVNYSSRGPTADNRIKPEVVAQGIRVYTVKPDNSGWTTINGTSASCPLVAGTAALVLSAHPDLTPLQVREAIMMTASQYSLPDNTYGYGLVNATDAVNYWGTKIAVPSTDKLIFSYPNPFCPTKNNFIRFRYKLSEYSHVNMSIYNVLGQKVNDIYDGYLQQGNRHETIWDGRDKNGNMLPAGSYFCRVKTDYNEFTQKILILH